MSAEDLVTGTGLTTRQDVYRDGVVVAVLITEVAAEDVDPVDPEPEPAGQ